ncbi:hypothetical protein protein [Bacillus cereus G9241]|nr:hypothetical protein protein [Bacillus cereus G9241]EAL13200.1 hypothetical protein protein [Bacillus cereus G9241]EAL14347.1 hypothetical protein protein [Bacillus cereus G9241]
MYNKHVIIPFLLLVLGVKRVFANSFECWKVMRFALLLH